MTDLMQDLKSAWQTPTPEAPWRMRYSSLGSQGLEEPHPFSFAIWNCRQYFPCAESILSLQLSSALNLWSTDFQNFVVFIGTLASTSHLHEVTSQEIFARTLDCTTNCPALVTFWNYGLRLHHPLHLVPSCLHTSTM